MEYMRGLEDNAFDLAIVDPPYGINMGKTKSLGKRRKTGIITEYKPKDWDTAIPSKSYFNELFRISKNQIIWGGNYFVSMLTNSSCWVVWDKQYIPEGFSMADLELAYTSFDSPSKKVRIRRNLVSNCVSNNKELAKINAKIHPTQKPVKLYEWLLINYAKEGDRILDTHLGSGSSAIAAHNLGFDFVGCEIDRDYYEAAQKRFKEVTSQLRIAL